MNNSEPRNIKKKNGDPKYDQGNYIPHNKDKVIKLNSKGGVYYRSGWEKKVSLYLDLNPSIIRWGAEIMEIPYTKVDYKTLKSSKHRYYPDFYYEIKNDDGTIHRVLMEVKPYHETIEPKLPSEPKRRQLENFEYALKMWNQNLYKWEQTIEYCKNKGIKFVILTEKQIKKL